MTISLFATNFNEIIDFFPDFLCYYFQIGSIFNFKLLFCKPFRYEFLQVPWVIGFKIKIK